MWRCQDDVANLAYNPDTNPNPNPNPNPLFGGAWRNSVYSVTDVGDDVTSLIPKVSIRIDPYQPVSNPYQPVSFLQDCLKAAELASNRPLGTTYAVQVPPHIRIQICIYIY